MVPSGASLLEVPEKYGFISVQTSEIDLTCGKTQQEHRTVGKSVLVIRCLNHFLSVGTGSNCVISVPFIACTLWLQTVT